MAKNTGRGSTAGRRDPTYGRFTVAKTNGGSFQPVNKARGAHHRPLTKAEKRSISYAFAYWFVACLLFIALLAGLVILVAP